VLYGHLAAPDAYAHLLAVPAWKLAFDWLKAASPETPAGIQQLQGDEIYVNVHGYETVARTQGRFESHRRYLDLQYCLAGGEMIDWWLASELAPDGGYDEGKDVRFYQPPADRLRAVPATTLRMAPGSFAIFHPSDAHCPKVQDGVNPRVFKLVIKIDQKRVGGA
jgi:biofilm protein TabA